MSPFIAAIDQGTTSTRCLLLNARGEVVASAQAEHQQHFPKPGWVEHDSLEIWQRTQQVIADALNYANATGNDIAAVGITNQRETTVVWNRRTGQPYANAIVWQDTRTRSLCDTLAAQGGADRFRASTGLPLATYFSGPKLAWLLDHIEGLRADAERGDALFGNIDSWLIWNLTGGANAGNQNDAQHVTDVTNASRTLLFNLQTLEWDEALLEAMNIPPAMLPRIVPSGSREAFGCTTSDGPFAARVPICSDLGDQQAALVGQTCFHAGDAKNTYGTGCFMLMNTGESPTPSNAGLLTTVAYQFENEPVIYALEGSIAMAGSLVQWLRDNLGMIAESSEIESLAASVDDNGGAYFVPAFSGLFAPHWRSDARGVIAGLTGYVNRGHLARAVLEATAFQTRDVLDAMERDSGVTLSSLRVDGGMTANHLLMQFQADILDVPVVRPTITETTAVGAAYAAGLAIGFWSSRDELREIWQADHTWQPAMKGEQRAQLYGDWKKAVQRTLNWET